MVNLPSGDMLVVFYSDDQTIPIPPTFEEPYHFYLAASLLRETI
jgi:hypothetical protein